MPEADLRDQLGTEVKDRSGLIIRGEVVSVRGSVVDRRLEDHLPAIYLLKGPDRRIVFKVLARRDPRHTRGIALMRRLDEFAPKACCLL